MSKPTQSAIFVTGATGNVGRSVVSQLVSAGHAVRALTRNPNSAGLPQEVDVVGGDLTVPASLEGSLEGIASVFLVWRGIPVESIAAFLDLAAKHARRIVFLSSGSVRDDVEQQTNPIGQAHADLERLIQRSGMNWTFLRPGAFATNSLMWWAPQIRRSDVLRWPYGAAAMTPIHERDIAAVAVQALTEPGHSGKKYILTGPQSLTQREQVRLIGEAIGRKLHFDEISPEVARQELAAFMPPFLVDTLLDAWSRTVDSPALPTSTVAEVTGSPAHTFREWAVDHASEFFFQSSAISAQAVRLQE